MVSVPVAGPGLGRGRSRSAAGRVWTVSGWFAFDRGSHACSRAFRSDAKGPKAGLFPFCADLLCKT